MLKIELCQHLDQAGTNAKERKLINSLNRDHMAMKVSGDFTVLMDICALQEIETIPAHKNLFKNKILSHKSIGKELNFYLK